MHLRFLFLICLLWLPAGVPSNVRCPGNAASKKEVDGHSIYCQTNETCGSTHFCQVNPTNPERGECCPLCPNLGLPKRNPNGQTVPCSQDENCGSTAYYCPFNVVKRPVEYLHICCPRCLDGNAPLLENGNNPRSCRQDVDCENAQYYCTPQNPTQISRLCCRRRREK